MRAQLLALSCSLGTILALQSPVQAQAADSQLPVSMERIRAGLKQPPAASAASCTVRRQYLHSGSRSESELLFCSQLTKNHSIPHSDCRQPGNC
jgi:hypothetical protein